MVPKLCKTFSVPSYRLKACSVRGWERGKAPRKNGLVAWNSEACDPEEVIYSLYSLWMPAFAQPPPWGLKILTDSWPTLEDFKNTASWCLNNRAMWSEALGSQHQRRDDGYRREPSRKAVGTILETLTVCSLGPRSSFQPQD